MPVINRIAGFADEMQGWRRHLHQHPELGFDCHQTAAFVAERLREFGVDEIHEGIARTGLVALIHGHHASTVAGKMHACGHDGHTTMLLGAAKYLAETRNFTGTVALIFQPAEEDGGGGGVMVDEGIMDRFKIDQVYAMHNAPGFPAGMFMTGPGPVLAAVDTFHVHVKGVGGHAANPHETRDPIPCAISIIQAVNTIVSRNAYAGDELVVSVTQIHAGSAENVIPDKAYVNGTVRTFDPAVQDLVEARLKEIVDGQAAAFGVEARLGYDRHYPATVNDVAKSEFAAEVARDVSTQVEYREAREMGAEDFSFMLQARPGAFMMLGQGVDSAGLHQPDYDFNDEIAPIGASYFVRLVERAQPVE